MVFAVNTESGIQDIRSLLVFLWPAGHSFADWIVVPAARRRNDAPSLGASWARVVTPSRLPDSQRGIGARPRRHRPAAQSPADPTGGCSLPVVSIPGVDGDRVQREL